MIRLHTILLGVALSGLLACQSSPPPAPLPPGETPMMAAPPAEPCGQSLLLGISSEMGLSVGSITLENDSSLLWLIFEPSKGRILQRSPLKYNLVGTSTWQDFPTLALRPDGIYAAAIDISAWEAGACLNLEGELLLQEAGGKVLKGRISSPERPNRISYCLQSCIRFSDLCAGLDIAHDFMAYPASEWLQDGGPTSHPLDATGFARALPQGLPVGCASPQHLRDMAAVRAWINSEKAAEERLLAKEFAGLALNLALDAAEPDFAPGPDRLAELVLSEGDFEGWTTQAVLDEIRTTLGDCPSNYALQQLVAAAAGINNNFPLPGRDQGFLRCPAD